MRAVVAGLVAVVVVAAAVVVVRGGSTVVDLPGGTLTVPGRDDDAVRAGPAGDGLPGAPTDPLLASFVPAGAPFDIDVVGRPGPIRIDLNLGDPPSPGSLAVLLRHDESVGGWYVAESADELDDGTLTAERTLFSPFWSGWIEGAGDWLDGAAEWTTDTVRGVFGQRTDPPECDGPPPHWATLDDPAIDVVLTCATTTADGDAEGRLVNNRGVVLEVVTPGPLAHTSVDGQPDWLRDAVEAVAGDGAVLLRPGQTMSAEWSRPADNFVRPVRVDITALGLLITAFEQSVGELVGAESWVAVPLLLSECGFAPQALDVVPDAADDLLQPFRSAVNCMLRVLPDASVQVATQITAFRHGVQPITVQSDRLYSGELDKLAGQMKALGAIGLAAKVVEVSSLLIDLAEDLWVNSDSGDYNGFSPVLTLLAADEWTLTAAGIGGIAGGLTVDQVERAEGVSLVEAFGGPTWRDEFWDEVGCALTTPDDPDLRYTGDHLHATGVIVMVLDPANPPHGDLSGPYVARVETSDPSFRTASGLGVGSTVADIEAEFGDTRLNTSAQAYRPFPEHRWIDFTPDAPDDHMMLRFVVEGDRVAGVISGLRGAVGFVEGCV